MSYFNKLDNARGGYIFLSHSHDDIKKVRELRNLLEEKGFEPLCFYLKCLTDDSEIEDLIKREIDAREWFLFVNSANSRKSKWVTLEREYITKTDSKKIISIDIDDVQDVRAGTEKILHNLRVFLSYSSKDVALARRINDKLVKKDYLVFFGDNQNLSNDAYLNEGINMLCQAAREGCVLVLLSMNSIQSPWVREELKSALLSGGNVIPVVVGDTQLPLSFRLALGTYQTHHLAENPSDQDIDRLVESVSRFIFNRVAAQVQQ